MEDQARLINFVIHSLKKAKTDDEKIAALFLVLKTNPHDLIKSKHFLDLYNAIGPVFIHRIIQSSNKTPIIEEVELGIQILSFFIHDPQITSRQELIPILKECLIACDLVKQLKYSRQSITEIFGHSLQNPKIITALQSNIIKYFSFIQYAEDCECDQIISITSKFLHTLKFTPKLEFLQLACSIINSQTEFKKFIFFPLFLSILSSCKSTFSKYDSCLNEVVEYCLCFLTSSKSNNNYSIKLIAAFLTIFDFEIFFKYVNNTNFIDLTLSFCVMEVEISLNFIMNSNDFTKGLSEYCQSCMYLIEIIINQQVYEIQTTTYDRVAELGGYLSQFLSDIGLSNNFALYFTCFRLVCFLHAFSANDLKYDVVIQFFAQVKALVGDDRTDFEALMTWVTPLLGNISTTKNFDTFVFDDDFLLDIGKIFSYFVNNMSINSCVSMINSEVFNNFLSSVFDYISHRCISIGSLPSFFNGFLSLIESELVTHKNTAVLLYLLAVTIALKLEDDSYAKTFVGLFKSRDIKGVLIQSEFTLPFLVSFLELIGKVKDTSIVDLSFDEIYSTIVSSEFYKRADLNNQKLISESVEERRF